MALDKRAAVRRRFALLVGTTDARRSGLPIGPPVDAEEDASFGRSTGTDVSDSTSGAHSQADYQRDDCSDADPEHGDGPRADQPNCENAR